MPGVGEQRFATVTANTTRAAEVDASSGLKSSRTAHLTDIKLTPFFPLDQSITERIEVGNPLHSLHAFNFADDDIKQGDRITPEDGQYAGEELDVTVVEPWPWHSGEIVRLIIVEREISE